MFLKWIENYLVNRTQKVLYDRPCLHQNKQQQVFRRVQFWVLYFFLVYVIDIVENLLSITRLFADDTLLAFTSSNLADLEGIF